MKVLNFHLCGKMAHFRRYYSNSSALSFSAPPRTTLIGIIAGLLGYERDSYYDIFSVKRCKVAVRIARPQKKQIHTLNLLMIKKPGDFNAYQPYPSQTATEMISPTNIRNGCLDYEVWFHHDDPAIMESLQLCLRYAHGYGSTGISLALGTAQHLGWTEGCREVEGQPMSETDAEIYSVIPTDDLVSLDLSASSEELHLVKENMPVHFHADRTVQSKCDFVINTLPSPVQARVRHATRLSDDRVITWMEA